MNRRRCARGGALLLTPALFMMTPATEGHAVTEHRYALRAEAESTYYEVDGEDIPASPRNAAGSLTAVAEVDSVGDSDSFVGAPYYGSALETSPGTVNGLAPAPLHLPFDHLPGFVTARYPAQPSGSESGPVHRLDATADTDSAQAQGAGGPPGGSSGCEPQQQTVARSSYSADGSSIAAAQGAAAAFATGPFHLGESVAQAQISDTGSAPKITSEVHGRFRVGELTFGFDKSGFHYLGQLTDAPQALRAATDLLQAAHITVQVAPQDVTTDPTSGIRTYTIGGLRVTTTQLSPTGVSHTVGFVLGRAVVSSVNTSPGISRPSVGTTPATVTGPSGFRAASTTPDTAPDRPSSTTSAGPASPTVVGGPPGATRLDGVRMMPAAADRRIGSGTTGDPVGSNLIGREPRANALRREPPQSAGTASSYLVITAGLLAALVPAAAIYRLGRR